jgi:hypothetical protein
VSDQKPSIVTIPEEELKTLLNMEKSDLVLQIIRLKQELKKYQSALGAQDTTDYQPTIAFVRKQPQKI